MTKEELAERIDDLIMEFLNSGGFIKEAAEVTKKINDTYQDMLEVDLEDEG